MKESGIILCLAKDFRKFCNNRGEEKRNLSLRFDLKVKKGVDTKVMKQRGTGWRKRIKE